MRDYTDEEKETMARFARYMNIIIGRRIHTVVRNYLNSASRSAGIPLEDLDEDEYAQYITTEDEYEYEKEEDVEIRIHDLSVSISSGTLLKLLGCLSPRERDTLLLSVGLELEPDEVAALLKLSNGRVRSYKSSALRKMRKEGEKEDGGAEGTGRL